MATNHTENYALNLWTPQDSFLREEFNENTEKIDEAVAACFQPGKLPWAFGTYTQLNTEDVVIDLGFKPSAIFLTANYPAVGIVMGQVSFLWGDNRGLSGMNEMMGGFTSQILENGFCIPARSYYFNDSADRLVTYLALR